MSYESPTVYAFPVVASVPLLLLGGGAVIDITAAAYPSLASILAKVKTTSSGFATGPDGLPVDLSVPADGQLRLRASALLGIAAGTKTFQIRLFV